MLTLSGVTITAFDMNVLGGVGNPVNVNIYTRSGTYSGNESSAAGWTLVSSGNGTSQGSGAATPIDVSDFFLASGLTGFAIQNVNFSHSYTNGANTYSNADISLTSGSATNTLFGSTVFSPRTWNGTVYYGASSVPEPASVSLVGLGLAGLIWRRTRNRGR